MRLTLLLLFALAGCSTIRAGLGELQKAGDRGVGIGATAGSEPAAAAGASDRDDRPALPAGLGGDKANRRYSGESPPF